MKKVFKRYGRLCVGPDVGDFLTIPESYYVGVTSLDLTYCPYPKVVIRVSRVRT